VRAHVNTKEQDVYRCEWKKRNHGVTNVTVPRREMDVMYKRCQKGKQ
jgi:hypothetical protein